MLLCCSLFPFQNGACSTQAAFTVAPPLYCQSAKAQCVHGMIRRKGAYSFRLIASGVPIPLLAYSLRWLPLRRRSISIYGTDSVSLRPAEATRLRFRASRT